MACHQAKIRRRFNKLKQRFSKIITQINFLKRRLFYLFVNQFFIKAVSTV